MTTVTHTQAGHTALAGVARLGAVAGSAVFGHHQSATWTVGAIAKPDTSMVLNRKNRPTRPLSERST
jgi:hypothetical protein